MPQLMPFMWVGSVLMGFMLVLVLILMYSYIKDLLFFIYEDVKVILYMIKW